MLAYAPLFPHPKEEKWNFIVADAANNTVYSRQEVSLIEAEAVGITHLVRSIPFQSCGFSWQQVLSWSMPSCSRCCVQAPRAPKVTFGLHLASRAG